MKLLLSFVLLLLFVPPDFRNSKRPTETNLIEKKNIFPKRPTEKILIEKKIRTEKKNIFFQ